MKIRCDKKIKLITIVFLVFILSLSGGCFRKKDTTGFIEPINPDENPIATIQMETGEVIKVELYPETAPNTVLNFIDLAQKGFYDGLIFHRVIKNFMIQGGDPEGTGMGGPGYTIKGEFTSNGFENNLSHGRGVISMARKSKPLDSAGSQFFIMHKDASGLDGEYAAFGRVIEGMEEVDRIAESQTDKNDKPLESQIIKTITVETFGHKYPKPRTIK